MLKISLLTSLLLVTPFLGAKDYVPHLHNEMKKNERMIYEYEKVIQQLKERNKYLQEQKRKNPKLYETKALFEETKNAYIQRIKLNGAKAKNINFKIEKNTLTLQMSMNVTKDDADGYYHSSRSFFQEYTIPNDVKKSDIKNYIEGDYFVIKMPKK